MGIEAHENRPSRVYGHVLHKCRGWSSGHHSDVYSGEFSAVVVGVAFLYFDVSHGLDPNSDGRLRRRTALGLIGPYQHVDDRQISSRDLPCETYIYRKFAPEPAKLGKNAFRVRVPERID